MTPEQQLLLEQATACRQLALIADVDIAAKLTALALDYEMEALIDRRLFVDRTDSVLLAG